MINILVRLRIKFKKILQLEKILLEKIFQLEYNNCHKPDNQIMITYIM